jgi:aldose 1-epimerase
VTPDGVAVDLYALRNDTGLRGQIITYGGTIVAIETPDRSGVRTNVVLALPSLADYVAQDAYLGALVGRYANRIGGASFILDGSMPPSRLGAWRGPRRFASVVAFLAGDGASYLAATTIFADGGLMQSSVGL